MKLLSPFFTLIVLVLLAFFSTHHIHHHQVSAAFGAFPPNVNSAGVSISDISKQVGLGADVPLRVSTLVDWHNSKNIDIVGIREDNPSCIEARRWDAGTNRFDAPLALTPGCATPFSAPSSRFYIAASAVDINRDGLLDLVATYNSATGGGVDIVFQAPASEENPAGIQVQQDVIRFPNNARTGNSTYLLNGTSVDLISYFGDCALIDIVAVNDQRKALVFRNAYFQMHGASDGAACTNTERWLPGNATFVPDMDTVVDDAVVGGTAAVDLDGDCAGEYVVARTNATATEILRFPLYGESRKNPGGVAQPSVLLSVPKDVGAPSWNDYDGDGVVDVAFPVCVERRSVVTPTSPPAAQQQNKKLLSSSALAIVDPLDEIDEMRNSNSLQLGGESMMVLYLVPCTQPNNFSGILVLINQHGETCSGTDCCKKFSSFHFDSIPLGSNIAENELPPSARLTAIYDSVSSMGVWNNDNDNTNNNNNNQNNGNQNNNHQNYTRCFLRSLDPVMMPVKIRAGDINDDMFTDALVPSTCGPLLLRNNDGSGKFTAAERFATAATTTVPTEDGALDHSLLLDEAALPFFFDIRDDGRLDILVIRQVSNFSSSSACVRDGNRSECRSGVFAFWHSDANDRNNYFITAATLNGATNLPHPAWGAIQIGASSRFQHLNLDNDKLTSAVTQLASSANFELALPRPHFGIGLTFASVMNFASGFVINGEPVSNSWPTVYLTPNSQILCVPYPITEPSSWVLRLYLLGEWDLQLVLIAWGVALAIIGTPIIVLGIREVREDRRSFGLS